MSRVDFDQVIDLMLFTHIVNTFAATKLNGSNIISNIDKTCAQSSRMTDIFDAREF